ncbi:MAG: DNA polymerase IV, partial [Terriglobales bacterium]
LLCVQAANLESATAQPTLLEERDRERWQQALAAADRLREKFGESAVSLGGGLKGGFRERTHDNPAALRGKPKAR